MADADTVFSPGWVSTLKFLSIFSRLSFSFYISGVGDLPLFSLKVIPLTKPGPALTCFILQ